MADIQNALKDLLGGTIKEMIEAELDDTLGYEKTKKQMNQWSITGTAQNLRRWNPQWVNWKLMCHKIATQSTSQKSSVNTKPIYLRSSKKIIHMYARGLTTHEISEQQDKYQMALSLPGALIFIRNVCDNAQFIFRKNIRTERNMSLPGVFLRYLIRKDPMSV